MQPLRVPGWVWVSLAVLILAAASMPFAAARLSDYAIEPPPAPRPPLLDPIYTIGVGVDGEIFPAFANYASLQRPLERRLSTVSVTITNPGSKPLRNRVFVQIPGWSDQEIQSVVVAPGEVRALEFAPSFLPRLYRNREITAATATVSVRDAAGAQVFQESVPVRLRAVQDLYWGSKFKYAPFIASWVTPHDPRVEQFLAEAKEFAPQRRLPGYETWKSSSAQVSSTYEQARAIYQAMQARGLSYVKSSMTLGNNKYVSERIRFPGESLEHVSANCIDAVVAYAAVFENLGMDSAVVLVPGHAYIALREAEGADDYLYIDVALTGRVSFETAVLSASQGLRKHGPQRTTHISVASARQQGIFPMPGFSPEPASPAEPALISAAPAPGMSTTAPPR
ncbi:MAG: hypothetical protein AB7O65_09250 [Candidatus Korobacteraceae bacterium]